MHLNKRRNLERNMLWRGRPFSRPFSRPFGSKGVRSRASEIIEKDLITTSGKDLGDDPGLFHQWVGQRRAEAKKTLFVQVKSKLSAEALYKYCDDNFGRVASMTFIKDRIDSFLVQFKEAESVEFAIKEKIKHRSDQAPHAIVPVKSNLMWFAGNGNKANNADVSIPSFVPVYDEEKLDEGKIKERLDFSSLDLDEQIRLHYDLTRSSDSETRVRFLACQQIELALSGWFPGAKVLPFGSSVNSFGSSNGDLDMCVSFEGDDRVIDEDQRGGTSGLVFHAKSTHMCHRTQVQRYQSLLTGMIKATLPGCQQVSDISHAKVPIVKFQHELLNLDCDVTNGSLSGYHMSDLLFMMGRLDDRVRPLAFAVKKWARRQGLVNDVRPTPYFTNFTLTLLVLFYLQCKPRILPTFQRLHDLARDMDRFTCVDGVDATFLRNPKGANLNIKTSEATISELLRDFFHFYGSEFDYRTQSASLVSGAIEQNRVKTVAARMQRSSYALDVVNPLEPELNVSGNVQDFAVQQFKFCCQISHRVLSEMMEAPHPQQRLERLFDSAAKEAARINRRDQGLRIGTFNVDLKSLNRNPTATVDEDVKKKARTAKKVKHFEPGFSSSP